jgi:hypothetical protein
MDENKKSADNGKGDAPRNNFSEAYRSRYSEIRWPNKEKKEKKPKDNTHND